MAWIDRRSILPERVLGRPIDEQHPTRARDGAQQTVHRLHDLLLHGGAGFSAVATCDASFTTANAIGNWPLS
jgi:hypothetical protein